MNNSERKKSIRLIVIFSVLVNVVAWVAPLLGGSPSSPGLGFILWGTAPLLGAILIRRAARDWPDLGIKPGFGKNLYWYLISILAFPILMIATLLVGVVFGLSSVTEFVLGKFLQTVLTALPIFLVFAIFEEVGWRGYLSPKLDALGFNRFTASALIALVWGTWHLPYIRELTWVYTPENLIVFIPRFYVVCFVLSILYGEIRSITGTLWPAVLMHAIGNAFGHPLAAEYVKTSAGVEYLVSVSNGLIFVALVSILGVSINQWRSRKLAASTSTVSI